MNYVPLIHGLRESSKFVYHYTKARTALDSILRNKTFRLGIFNRTNDPRESREWRFNMGSLSKNGHPLLDKYGDGVELSKALCAALQGAARVGCFCSDSPGLTGNPIDDIYLRGLAKPRMWAQYGEDHLGVCLVFDRDKLGTALDRAFREQGGELLVSSPVTYRNHWHVASMHENEFSVTAEDLALHGLAHYPLEHLRRYWARLFFEKSLDWSGESEWRVLGFTKKEGPADLPFADSLVGVIHGAGMSIEMSKAIIDLTDRPEIEHMGMTWTNGAPWYDIGSIKLPWLYSDRRLFERIEARRAAKAADAASDIPAADDRKL